MKRLFDLVLALIAASLLLVPIFVVAVLVKLTSKGPSLYWSARVGIHNTIFRMPKFCRMKVETPVLATHLWVVYSGKDIYPLTEKIKVRPMQELSGGDLNNYDMNY